MFDDLTACKNYQPNEDLITSHRNTREYILGGKDRLIDSDQAKCLQIILAARFIY